MLPEDIDPITFEVIRNGLDTLVDEMALTVMRTAHSGVVKDAMDYSTAFCDRNGQVVAQGLTIVCHLGSFPAAVASVIDKYGDTMAEGDMFILNDPYTSGGIHLPDIYVIQPVFVDGEPEGFAGVVAHHTDVGGIVPGSNSTDSTEIYQEGLRIPTLRLYDRGEPVEAVFALLATNVRVPDKVLGDLRAQIAAAHTGERGLVRLTDRYGSAAVRRYMDVLIDHSEHLAREEIEALPDGTYRATGYIDADNVPDGPLVLQVAVTIDGDRVVADFEGSSNQMKAGINSPVPFTRAAVYGALRLLMDPGIPNSAGYTRLIEVRTPIASVVDPVLPAACGARGITGFRIMDTVLAALAQAVPNRVPADGEGGNTIISIGGHDRSSPPPSTGEGWGESDSSSSPSPSTGEGWGEGDSYTEARPFAYVDLFAGARGARPTGDGPDGVAHPAANISNTPVEIAEVESPVRIEEYGLLPDSGGAGKYRGALSEVRSVRCLADEALLQLRSDKRAHPPFGLQGGAPGSPSYNILNPGDDQRVLTTMGTAPMRRGDLIRHELASGGGWGDPLERDPASVLADFLDEKVTADHARQAYGVVINPTTQQVDTKATEQLRQTLR